MPIDIDIQRVSTSVTMPDDHQFQLWAETILDGKRDEAVLVVRIVDEEEACRFNHDYRGKDYASNVLSFPLELPAGLPVEIANLHLGDILLCAPVVAREALEQKKQEAHHWAHLMIHGVLHLLGYDHENIADAQAMESLEKESLATLGINDPYH